MNEFRIIQIQPLTEVLPFIVEERRQVWYLPWPVWRPIKEWSSEKSSYWAAPRKFQSIEEARRHIERRQIARAKRKAQQQHYSQKEQLPRVIQLLKVPMQG
jgi:hypothetical protein